LEGAINALLWHETFAATLVHLVAGAVLPLSFGQAIASLYRSRSWTRLLRSSRVYITMYGHGMGEVKGNSLALAVYLAIPLALEQILPGRRPRALPLQLRRLVRRLEKEKDEHWFSADVMEGGGLGKVGLIEQKIQAFLKDPTARTLTLPAQNRPEVREVLGLPKEDPPSHEACRYVVGDKEVRVEKTVWDVIGRFAPVRYVNHWAAGGNGFLAVFVAVSITFWNVFFPPPWPILVGGSTTVSGHMMMIFDKHNGFVTASVGNPETTRQPGTEIGYVYATFQIKFSSPREEPLSAVKVKAIVGEVQSQTRHLVYVPNRPVSVKVINGEASFNYRIRADEPKDVIGLTVSYMGRQRPISLFVRNRAVQGD
jgi:hypothetical protein